ncbi:MAG: DMT family transporter [Chloroflexota bacterium]
MVEQRSPLFLPFAIILAIVSVSTASLFIRFAQLEAPSLVIAALRLTIASLLIAPIAIIRHRDEMIALTKKELLLGLLSGFFLALHFATWITSLEYTSVASSVVLVSTAPIWVALLSPFFLHESLSRKILWGLFLATFGGSLIGLSDLCNWQSGLVCPTISNFLNSKSMQGNLLALTGAIMVTGYLLIGRHLRTRMSLITYIFLVYSMASIVLIAFMVIARQSPFGFSGATYGWIFLLALIPQIIGHSTYNWALRFLPATVVAVITLGEPIGSASLAYIILHESPGLIKILGMTFILAGIYLASTVEKRTLNN